MAETPEPEASEAGAALRPDERREWPRVPAEQLAETALRLTNGSEVRLVDLSRGGARLETDRRMLPNSTIAVKLVTGGEHFVVTGMVVRSRVIRLSQGGLGYDVAIAFNEAVPRLAAVSASPTVTTGPSPLSPTVAAKHTTGGDWTTSMIQVTANVPHSARELRDLFDESAW